MNEFYAKFSPVQNAFGFEIRKISQTNNRFIVRTVKIDNFTQDEIKSMPVFKPLMYFNSRGEYNQQFLNYYENILR